MRFGRMRVRVHALTYPVRISMHECMLLFVRVQNVKFSSITSKKGSEQNERLHAGRSMLCACLLERGMC